MAINITRRRLASLISESTTRTEFNSLTSIRSMTSSPSSTHHQQQPNLKDSKPSERENAKEEPKRGSDETQNDGVSKMAPEIGGPMGPEPTRYGDWEKGGRCSDF